MKEKIYLPWLLNHLLSSKLLVILICGFGLNLSLTAQVNFDWCESSNFGPGCITVVELTIDASQQTTDGGGTMRNTYTTPVTGSCNGLLGTNAYRIKYNTSLNRWEVEFDGNNSGYPPYENGVIFHSSEATAPNPPNMATGNWTYVTYTAFGGTVVCSGLKQLDGAGTQDAVANTAPTIAVADFNYTAGQSNGDPVLIDGSATASDTEDNWNGGSLTVQITTNNEANDEISISETNTSLSGSSVQDGATTFGTISESSGTANDGVVTNGDLLTITFNSNATDARVQALVRDIAYRSTSSTPSTSARTVTYFLSDDTEGTTETAVINVSIPLPTVTIAIEGSTSVTEDSGGTITYRFTRTGATATDLDVNYSIGGTTQNKDFTVTTDANTTYISGTRTGTITILSGSSTADLVITPLDETLIEAAETVVVKIENP